MSTEQIEITGTVCRLFAQKPDWCAGELTITGKWTPTRFKVKGYVVHGEPVTLRGKWVSDKKFGKQFDAAEVVYTAPANPDGLVAWLKWHVKGLGAVKSQRLVDEFGMELPGIAQSDPRQIAIFAEVPIESVNQIAESWVSFGEKIAVYTELANLGLTKSQCEKLYGVFKGSILTIIRSDPYLLLRKVPGFGWVTIDEIAMQKLGFPVDHPGRMQAAVITTVATGEGDGYTAMNQPMAVGKAGDLLDLAGDPRVELVVGDAVETGRLHQLAGSLALPESFRHETLIWKRLGDSRLHCPHISFRDAQLYTTVGDKTLDDSQQAALEVVASSRLSFVTGGAGSGKTLTARAIHKMFTDDDIPVYLCAPTGKAARRMEQVIGKDALTIHRLLGFRPDGAFEHDEFNHLPDGVVLCDEVSMVSSSLAYSLFRAIGPRTAFVGIGDPNQLPPVGPGALLRDVIDHDLAPVATLTQCHRQAGPLKSNCHAILEGRVEPTADGDPAPWMVHRGLHTPELVATAVMRLWVEYLPGWGYDPIHDTQFLTAQKKGPCGTKYLNKLCQHLHQRTLDNELPKPKPDDDERPTLYVGDKVIHVENNYTLDVMNGTQGVVVAEGKHLSVDYDGKFVDYPAEFRDQVELSYVLTAHKAQGSEWPCAVVICPKRHAYMQTRTWLYTACTRAQQTCVLMGDEEGIRRAAENDQRDERETCLAVWAKNPEVRP